MNIRILKGVWCFHNALLIADYLKLNAAALKDHCEKMLSQGVVCEFTSVFVGTTGEGASFSASTEIKRINL